MRTAFIRMSTALLFTAPATTVVGQTIETLTRDGNASLRGLSAVSDQVVWVSGSNGRVGRSVDGGRNWVWATVGGHEKTDFRDIEAFDDKTAVVMGVAEPGVILRTVDGGTNWTTVYIDSSKGVFLDAMDFLPEGRGVAVGDPIDGRLYLLETVDFGKTWRRIPTGPSTALREGEAFFAASGTNVRMLPDGRWVAVTGGKSSRLLTGVEAFELPTLQGRQSTGANSIGVSSSGGRWMVVGGDFSSDTTRDSNCHFSDDGGVTWKTPQQGPSGYRSCVEAVSVNSWLACGTSGVDLTLDDGSNWRKISGEGFHVCRRAKAGSAVFLAGAKGRVARLAMER